MSSIYIALGVVLVITALGLAGLAVYFCHRGLDRGLEWLTRRFMEWLMD